MWTTTGEDEARRFIEDAMKMSASEVEQHFMEEMSKHYRFAWGSNWSYVPKDVPLQYGTAVFIYTLYSPNICKVFNSECRNACEKSKPFTGWKNFPFKCYWWLLLEGLLSLPQEPTPTCTLYRGVHDLSVGEILAKTEIIFGQFASATESSNIAGKFGQYDGICLQLNDVPCSVFRKLDRYANQMGHFEALLVPFCVFEVLGEVELEGYGYYHRTTVALQYKNCLLEEWRSKIDSMDSLRESTHVFEPSPDPSFRPAPTLLFWS